MGGLELLQLLALPFESLVEFWVSRSLRGLLEGFHMLFSSTQTVFASLVGRERSTRICKKVRTKTPNYSSILEWKRSHDRIRLGAVLPASPCLDGDVRVGDGYLFDAIVVSRMNRTGRSRED